MTAILKPTGANSPARPTSTSRATARDRTRMVTSGSSAASTMCSTSPATATAPPRSLAGARLRAAAPLVHNITNYVVMNNTANALLAIGASPAMIHAAEEVEDFVAISGALVVNIGTLSPDW
eukprot:gene20296-24882_t